MSAHEIADRADREIQLIQNNPYSKQKPNNYHMNPSIPDRIIGLIEWKISERNSENTQEAV